MGQLHDLCEWSGLEPLMTHGVLESEGLSEATMSLSKEDKKQYQKEYMRKLRSNKSGLTTDGSNMNGLDGWHIDERGRSYILQRNFNGLVKRYNPGPPEFMYYERVKG